MARHLGIEVFSNNAGDLKTRWKVFKNWVLKNLWNVYQTQLTAARYVLRLFTGVVLEVVAFVLIGVDVVIGSTFSGSESEFSRFSVVVGFSTSGAISFNISFWFSARILVRSDIISFLRDILISSSFSGWVFREFIRTCYVAFSLIILRCWSFKLSWDYVGYSFPFLTSGGHFWLEKKLWNLWICQRKVLSKKCI